MTYSENHIWQEENKQYLMTAITLLRNELEDFGNLNDDQVKRTKRSISSNELQNIESKMQFPAAIEFLSATFNLSSFERKIILMCAGMELDSEFPRLLQSIQKNSSDFLPSFGLALALFKDAHWSALSPERPLRYWRFIELDDNLLLTKSHIRLTERILNFLTGIQYIDEHLNGILELHIDCCNPVPSQMDQVNKILRNFTSSSLNYTQPIIVLRGSELSDSIDIASTFCSHLKISLCSISTSAIPADIKERNELIRIWNRESLLGSLALFVNLEEIEMTEQARRQSILTFCERIQSVIFIGCKNCKPKLKRPIISIDVNKPSPNEQLTLWNNLLKDHSGKLNGFLSMLVSHFNFSRKTIQDVTTELCERIETGCDNHSEPNNDLEKIIWRACCNYAYPDLNVLVQRIIPLAVWDDLILPEQQKRILREIAMQVRRRYKVYSEWGFAAKTSRGLGISALFSGASGTGKTMASEVLANELQLDLYHIDLSQVVNKYIGETEKNLKHIFDKAEQGGVILLFDEADALFGKRSDVKDSHDRYANIEVSYLLQRMEAFNGLAILTTNLKTAIDRAFLRRIRFVVQFPFPDHSMRAKIWQGIFPAKTPTAKLDFQKLAMYDISGGNIHNIAMNAAFIAADRGESINMDHISSAVRTEYSKLEKTIMI